MKNAAKTSTHFSPRSPYRAAVEKLNAALERNTTSDNTHKIRLLRMAMFGDVDRLQQSGAVKIPE